MSYPPPVILFTYNRGEKARQVLNSLCAQGVEHMYIFCDGAKDNEQDQKNVKENQRIVKQFPLRQKEIVISPRNKGLANSIIDGISQVLEQEQDVLIVEDDCLPFPQFYRFMSKNLDYWRNFHEVFSVSAYQFIRSEIDIPYDVFLSQRFLPWGWGTWKDRWEKILPELKARTNPYKSFANVPDTGGRDMLYHCYAVEKKMVDSWAIPLGMITLAQNFKHIMPVQPLVNNTGMDDTGTNTGSEHNRIKPVPGPPQYQFPLRMCPLDFHDDDLNRHFMDSFDVMLPPDWLYKKIHQELSLIFEKEQLHGV